MMSNIIHLDLEDILPTLPEFSSKYEVGMKGIIETLYYTIQFKYDIISINNNTNNWCLGFYVPIEGITYFYMPYFNVTSKKQMIQYFRYLRDNEYGTIVVPEDALLDMSSNKRFTYLTTIKGYNLYTVNTKES
jgi:hypothetical protein